MTLTPASSWLTRSAPVAAAQAAGRPLVALESTIIAHGMPYPQNVRTAREVEAVIRDARRRAGHHRRRSAGASASAWRTSELELLGRSRRRASRSAAATCPAVLASGELGATTVAATMICAALAGIEVFVTGGIGGVHRGARDELRHLGRPAGTGADLGGRGLRRREVDPGHRPDARIPGDPRRAGAQLRPGQLRRLLHARQRLSAPTSGWTTPRSRRASSAPSGTLGLAGGVVVEQPGAGGARDAARRDRRASPQQALRRSRRRKASPARP